MQAESETEPDIESGQRGDTSVNQLIYASINQPVPVESVY